MEKVYFNCLLGPVGIVELVSEFEKFVISLNQVNGHIGTVATNTGISKERFDLLRQINLIDTPTLKRMLNK